MPIERQSKKTHHRNLVCALCAQPLTEGVAGRLVRMAEGQAVTFKLTKKLTDMHPIEELPGRIRAIA